MFSRILIFAGVLLAASTVHAQDRFSCAVAPQRFADENGIDALDSGNPETIVFEAGEVEAQLGDSPNARLSGGVLLRQGDKLAGADSASYDAGNAALLLEGQVRYEDSATQIASDSAEFGVNLGRIRFEGASFFVDSNNGRGAADVLQIDERGLLTLDGVRYTTCPPDSNDWLLEARDIDLDTRNGVGTARGIKLRFQNVPVLYAPYLSFPVGDARKSGILTPEIGSTGRSGSEVRVPYYWNIAPNYDATITPRLLTDRGMQLQTEFRYLSERSEGQVNTEYLNSDTMFNDTRHLLQLRHRTLFVNGWRGRVDLRDVSDSQYFEDLGGSLSLSSITHLNRSISFDYQTEHLEYFARIQDYQTIDDAIGLLDEPYQRVPQLVVRGSWPDQWLGLHYKLDSEIVRFERDAGVTGWRVNIAPEIALPFKRPGWFVTPAVALDHTSYALSNTEPGQIDDPSRSLPIASLDAGLLLERQMQGANEGRIQTLEPRVLYVHVPHRDQDQIPVFDTIAPDLNLVQLYKKNRFLGVDRIADTDQVSLGVTSRILDVRTGQELVSATIGQTRYLSLSGVQLPGEPLITNESSDYIAEVGFLLYENLNFDVGHQWGRKDRGTSQSEARLQYRPARNKILNLAYRFRRDSLEQGDLSWSWPLSRSWNFVGRYNFSFRDSEPLEEFFGLEYESCCWGLRLVSRRHISTRDGTRDSSFGLQLVLKGMSSVGTKADKLLERGILGYSADLR